MREVVEELVMLMAMDGLVMDLEVDGVEERGVEEEEVGLVGE